MRVDFECGRVFDVALRYAQQIGKRRGKGVPEHGRDVVVSVSRGKVVVPELASGEVADHAVDGGAVQGAQHLGARRAHLGRGGPALLQQRGERRRHGGWDRRARRSRL